LAKFFISHSSKDASAAQGLIEWLTSRGYDHVFLDIDGQHGIPPGGRHRPRQYRTVFGHTSSSRALSRTPILSALHGAQAKQSL
jgi:hypothetical protein